MNDPDSPQVSTPELASVSWQQFLSTPEDTISFGREFAQTLQEGTIVALSGDLGAGKTTLAKGIISQLAKLPIHTITSPTYTYVHTYEGAHHFDLYRLQGEEFFLQMGFSDFFDGESIVLIEWPERIQSLIPNEAIWVTLIREKKGRRIDVSRG